jgi:hypothetical protein
LDSVLGLVVQLTVHIVPNAVDDKDLVYECTKLHDSLWAAVDAISTMASPEFTNVSLAKCQVTCVKYVQGKFSRYTMEEVFMTAL